MNRTRRPKRSFQARMHPRSSRDPDGPLDFEGNGSMTPTQFRLWLRRAHEVEVHVVVTPDDGSNLKVSKAQAMRLVASVTEEDSYNVRISALVTRDAGRLILIIG